jgi:hypothetical protein
MNGTMNSPHYPTFPSFKDVELVDKEIIGRYLRRYPPLISEYTFSNLFVWRHSHPVQWCVLDGALCILRKDEELAFYPPVGEGDVAEMAEKLFEYARSLAVSPRMIKVPKTLIDSFGADGFSIQPQREHFDYVYRRTDLADLPGRPFSAKRNLINKCLKSYAITYAPITEDTIGQCLSLQTDWCDVRQCNRFPDLANEFEAIKEMFSNYRELELIGGAISLEGSIQAFAVGERLNENTAVIHFEKANPDVTGLYQLINKEFVTEALGDFEYVNREQDLGNEGLRKAKLSYHPDHFVEKYTVQKAA